MRDEWTANGSSSSSVTNAGYQPLGSSASGSSTSSSPGSSSSSTPASTNKYGFTADSRSSQGLTRVGRHYELDRGASLNLAARAMKLKLKTKGLGEAIRQREVGDAETLVNALPAGGKEKASWWKNVTPEEGT
ncbi:hypothetical protein LTR91_001553 [Friedmanniomyces endolithicus]|uniref:Uncharacterized protein n=1 Tax=Friedmanniomyces endolithicus TaxID=329885 RepID=A0AAN6L2C9_9PEZI|nr:hypothetical protein LTR35_015826 [Friedmanniomyces endolithicus]KAK0275758.1 hypothetical protein LTS00_014905 [Friedmanniomyces endolithicus]KAK0327826.1 hypothetical protein LTR82_001343 [Friedmanniomyces endolithicus]KAK0918644.1 hypothetical protein LTR57_011598 [Friedmanniomyces endolithicus]KAK0979762.1 hypothetical protein LTR54_015530 [Friedmanniomyces endolithicus]